MYKNDTVYCVSVHAFFTYLGKTLFKDTFTDGIKIEFLSNIEGFYNY